MIGLAHAPRKRLPGRLPGRHRHPAALERGRNARNSRNILLVAALGGGGSRPTDEASLCAQDPQAKLAWLGAPPISATGFTPFWPATPPVPNPQVRDRDSYGQGYFGASRDDGGCDHLGVDIVAASGTPVTSPVDGKYVGSFDPYRGVEGKQGRYTGLQLETSDGNRVGLSYVGRDSALQPQQAIVAGQTPLGTVQELGPTYPGITNHVHIGISRQEGGNTLWYNPTPLFVPNR